MFEVQLERIRVLSESTMDFRFVRTDGENVNYTPGQFFRFVFTDADGEFERSYSPCNFDELYGTHLDVVISRVESGRATRYLFNCKEGITATVTGPYGRLTVPLSPSRLILVATSVGLAPFMPILKQFELEHESPGSPKMAPQILLILGVRDPSEFLYREQLLDYRQRHPNFELNVCYSRDEPVHDYERKGYVTAQLGSVDLNPETDHCLLCGNPNMIDEAYEQLKARGFTAKKVTREKYVFARGKKGASKTLNDDERRLIAEKMKKYQS
jgi:ferredoxin-NADP reductase